MNRSTLKIIPAILLASAAVFGSSAHAAGERAIITPAANACRPLHTGDGKKLEFDEFGTVTNKSADFFVDLVCSIPVSVGPDGLIVGVTGTTLPNKPIPLCDASTIGAAGKHSELFPMPPQGGRFNTTVVFGVASGEISRYNRVVSFCRLNPFSRIEAFSAEEIDF
jgi:hypothetical protein